MSSVLIEPTRIRDLAALAQAFRAATLSSFAYLPTEQQRVVVNQNNLGRLTMARLYPRRILISARDASGLVGYAIGGVDNGIATLYWLYVLPTMRGQNIGLKLLAATRRHSERLGAGQLTLCTHDHERYYRRQGFEHRGVQELHGIPMHILRLRLA